MSIYHLQKLTRLVHFLSYQSVWSKGRYWSCRGGCILSSKANANRRGQTDKAKGRTTKHHAPGSVGHLARRPQCY